MSTKAVPAVPQRPSRSPNNISPPKSETPRIPPRPVGRLNDRSASPMPDRYAPSPLNDIPGEHNSANKSSTDPTGSDVPSRPSSVTIPSVGQEGIEYANLDRFTESGDIQQPAETRNVNENLHLHAPRPSLPKSSAKAQVQAVTRTDSQQAAAAGFGKHTASSHDDSDRIGRPLHSRADSSRQGSSAASHDRRISSHWGDDTGIPEFGQRVPMYPNAGDVQAPSPAPYGSNHGRTPSVSSPGRPGRHHTRSRSGRDVSLPPGSYGLHGHGLHSNDRFEKAWYEKHPDELVREEQGQYGPGLGTPRPEWAMSSDDLNKIVRSSANVGTGLGKSAG